MALGTWVLRDKAAVVHADIKILSSISGGGCCLRHRNLAQPSGIRVITKGKQSCASVIDMRLSPKWLAIMLYLGYIH